MLSREDYENYLNQISKIEMSMSDLYKEYAAKVEDSRLEAIFLKLSKEEEQHFHMVEQIAALITDELKASD